MTRFLSESLKAPEPIFHIQLKSLEEAHGHPCHDIRLSNDIMHMNHQKLMELGLDPHDTTGKELYQALLNKFNQDDAYLYKKFRSYAASYISAEAELNAGMIAFIKQELDLPASYALKTAKFKSLIKKNSPKKSLKQLGYRSLDAYLRHESPGLILLAAELFESKSWWQQLYQQYKMLQSLDFELKPLSLIQPTASKSWHKISSHLTSASNNRIYCYKELGVVTILPIENSRINRGDTFVSLLNILQSIISINSASNYLQIRQMQPDFGKHLLTVVKGEPQLKSELFNQHVPWYLVQKLFDGKSNNNDMIFDYYQIELKKTWNSIGQIMKELDQSLNFWWKSEISGIVENGLAISMNVFDVAVNVLQSLPFEKRLIANFQQSLWQELLLQYMNPQVIERAVQQPRFFGSMIPVYQTITN